MNARLKWAHNDQQRRIRFGLFEYQVEQALTCKHLNGLAPDLGTNQGPAD